MSKNLDIVREFVENWSAMDAAQLAEYFTEDGTYYNMPANPVTGREQVKGFIEAFLSTWTETTWDILNMAEHGDVVFCERLDRTRTIQGDVDLPCVGVFEMRDGKIQVWRDYFDMGTYTKAMS